MSDSKNEFDGELIAEKLDQILSAVSRRDLESKRGAEMFEGLRRQVVAARTARNTHLVDLAQVASAIDHGAESADLALLVRDLLNRAGVDVVRELTSEDEVHFELSSESAVGNDVVEPAYVDSETRRTIRMGRVE